MILPLILIAFLIWTLINGTTAKYISFATTKQAMPANGGNFGGQGATGAF